jgi:ParE toxin of type II toxin-antitoxin system, parDE
MASRLRLTKTAVHELQQIKSFLYASYSTAEAYKAREALQRIRRRLETIGDWPDVAPKTGEVHIHQLPEGYSAVFHQQDDLVILDRVIHRSRAKLLETAVSELNRTLSRERDRPDPEEDLDLER